ncbi:uncharacterized protein LOC114713091 [Neltuma alba]|uniref:uncharacterized protein LOC114713091 n=1 Tax=Neltuma alba TaxID=207710 RepID=UPI0010A352E6|nr:uncharacterized protein LOC114713091 [Prosopis alba]
MASRRPKRGREQLSSPLSAQLPRDYQNLSLPHMAATSPIMAETSTRLPDVPLPPRPSLSPTSPQMPSPGTEYSQPHNPQDAPSRLTPWGRDASDGKTWIYPEKKTFNPSVATVRNILPVIQAKFDHPCYCWKATPLSYKQLWFAKWAKNYKWLPQHEEDIKRNWNAKCAEILRNTMHNVRNDLFKKNARLGWILESVMDDLEKIWTSEDYKAKSEIAKANRASSTGGTQHKAAKLQALELGRNPTMFELFKKTHYNEKTKQFVDQRSASVYDDYMRRKASMNSDATSQSVQSNDLEDINIWFEVTGGKNKKGRFYGLGSEGKDIGSSSHVSSSSINNTGLHPEFESELQNRVQELRQQNQEIMQQNREIRQENQEIRQENQNLKDTIFSRLKELENKISGPSDQDSAGNDC